MFIVLETEIKNDYKGKLEYAQTEIIGSCNTIEQAIDAMKARANQTISNGYYDEIIFKTNKCITIHNGGTAYKQYSIDEI